MRELYINGKLVELDSQTRLDLQYKSFLFSGISELTAPRSWTVSLPKSASNLALIEGASSGDSDSNFPYDNYVVDYYSKGYRVINQGKGILIKITDRIEFTFTFGKAYEAIKLMSEKKLTELTETATDYLRWNRSVSFNNMTAGFGWCNYYSFTNEDRSWITPNADVPFGVVHPTVLMSWLINKIGIETDFTFDLSSLSILLGNYSFPLKKSDGISSIGENPSSNVSFTGIEASVTKIKFTAGTVNFFTLPNTTDFTSSNNSVVVHITSFNCRFSNGNDDCYLKICNNQGVIRTIIKAPMTAVDDYKRYDLTNYTFQFNSSDSYFFFSSPSGGTGFFSSSLIFETVLDAATYIGGSSGGYYPIIPNLPDMTCSEFIFQCMQLVGVFPSINDETPTVIDFYSCDTIYDNIPNAKNWSNKLVKDNVRMNELSDVTFKFGNYAKKNVLTYKVDETNQLLTSDFLIVDSDNLPEKSTLIDIKFAAGRRFSQLNYIIDYPLYDIKIQSGVLVKNAKQPNNDVIGEIVSNGGINYIQFTNDMLWSSIKATDNYLAYQSLIQKPRYLREKFYLKPEDVTDISLEIPIYLEQYGKYYAIMLLQYKEDEISECELLEIKNI